MEALMPDGAVKRGFDLAVAVSGLLLLSPLLLAIAVAIRCDTRGPVLFRQERVGRGGRLFRIHKFRTMVSDAAARGPQLTIGDDARITRVGRFLRHSKLDELPQLLDVLGGQMSLVGPRPELPRYVALYPAALRDRVLAVRPGITDPVSLAFADESALLGRADDPEREYVEVILPRKLGAAAEYAAHANLTTDLVVIARTLLLLLRRSLRRDAST
jgi:lipopolysaccharide/colanic/teichoic acid biosynthesis glycosyltransferase